VSEVREDAVAKAARLGLLLVKPTDEQVFVDLDSLEQTTDFFGRWPEFLKLWPLATYKMTPSTSGKPGRHHVIVTVSDLKPLADHERIALQAALGSDPLREMLAIYHGRAGYEHTSVFFEKPIAEAANHG
jgi:hypothetical protein